MKQLMKRLKNKAGETLVESMAAILIFTFGSIIMYSMISAAADINEKVRKSDKSFSEQLVAAESVGGSAVNGTVTITYGTSMTDTDSVKVSVYSNGDEGALYAYYPEEVLPVLADQGGQIS